MIALFLLACGPEDLVPGFDEALTDVGGCGDLTAYARDPERTIGILVRTDDDLVGTAATSQTYDLAETANADVVTLHQGVAIGEVWCNDVSTGAEDIQRSWHATAGSLVIDVTPEDYGGTATVTLTDGILTADDDERTSVPLGFTWSDLSVGWLPG